MSPTAHPVASNPQPSKTNYFLGQDASKWHANVPTYGTLRWEGAYPGVNLAFGRSGVGLGVTVEGDRAGLALRVEGADDVRVDASGRLVADTAIGPVALPPWLARDGTPLHPTVGEDGITFAAHPFPESPSLGSGQAVDSAPADDPSDLRYSTYLGGSDFEISYDMALGPDGSAYVTGWVWSTDFPTTPGAFDPTFNGLHDATVTRLSPDGTTPVYSTFLGGDNDDWGAGIAVDGSGAAYVSGYTWSSDFPTSPGAYDTTCDRDGRCTAGDAFITKLSPDGSALVYSTFLGGSQREFGWDIALGSDGSAYVTGSTESSNFPTTPDAYDRTCGTDGRCNPHLGSPQEDVFVSRLSADGSTLIYSTFLGGGRGDCAYECYITLGADGAIYVSGNTCSTDFPTTPGAFDTSFNGASGDCDEVSQGDVYVTKLSADGSTLVYSTYLGGSGDDWSGRMALGADGTVYVTGLTYSADYPTTPSAFDPTCNSCPTAADGFITRLDAQGATLVYSTYLGGSGTDYGTGIAVGVDGTAYVTGVTTSSDFPTTASAFQANCAIGVYGCEDAYLVKLSADGSALVYSTFLGGTSGDNGTGGLALGADGTASIAGITTSTDLPTSPGAYDPSFNGYVDLFLARLSPDLVQMYVAGITPFYRPRGGRYLVGARITIQDVNSAPVSGAAVTINIIPPGGNQLTFTNTTDTSGRVLFRSLVRSTGTYTFTVTGVTKYGWLYDPSLNVETSDSITIP